ncbi:hypothetical protein CF327_g5339 [Tilletia walkeri]|uniref:Transcription and mRNA export factor SUS1 n=1 Tax=Tilletia walkeri TaxID=117179 RepID=A0A8X7N9T9_9BASI|nr:hypothetical protein CF327_g5339 [Tilletia walkeri]KAE8268614.1 hypothetical protein A4X09_0g3718 [Tilletia walkeri]
MASQEQLQHQQQQEDDISELFAALHQRMVQSGDWNRILGILRRMLEDCGYEESLQKFAADQAREQERLQLAPLLGVLSPYAKDTLPAHVRDHIGALIRDFLDRNVEDA